MRTEEKEKQEEEKTIPALLQREGEIEDLGPWVREVQRPHEHVSFPRHQAPHDARPGPVGLPRAPLPVGVTPASVPSRGTKALKGEGSEILGISRGRLRYPGVIFPRVRILCSRGRSFRALKGEDNG